MAPTPSGLSAIIKARRFGEILPSYGLAGAATAALLAALIFAVEMIYHLSLEAAAGTSKTFFGVQVDVASAPPWLLVAVLTLTGGMLLRRAMRSVSAHWDRIMGDIIKAQTT